MIHVAVEGRLQGAFHDITERKQAELSLFESKNFNASVIDSLTKLIAVLDVRGVIVAVNEAWRRYAISNGAPESLVGIGIGANYLEVCEKARDSPQGEDARQTEAGIRAVLTGELPEFHLEYPCHTPTELRWFQVTVAPMKGAIGGRLSAIPTSPSASWPRQRFSTVKRAIASCS